LTVQLISKISNLCGPDPRYALVHRAVIKATQSPFKASGELSHCTVWSLLISNLQCTAYCRPATPLLKHNLP